MKVSLRTALLCGSVLFLLYIINFFYAVTEDQTGGTFGDTFGAVNALFSGSALFFLVLAFISQREELNLVRSERDDTRRILKGQELLIEHQQRAVKMQGFEQSFFSSLSALRDLDNELQQRAMAATASDWATASTTCLDAIHRFSADPCSTGELREKLGQRGTKVLLFCELAFFALSNVETSAADEPQKLSYSSALKTLVSRDSATCLFAYLLSIDDRYRFEALSATFTKNDLESSLHEGLEKAQHYFSLARAFHNSGNESQQITDT